MYTYWIPSATWKITAKNNSGKQGQENDVTAIHNRCEITWAIGLTNQNRCYIPGTMQCMDTVLL